MSPEKAEKIYQLYVDNHKVIIFSHYVDGFARLHKNDRGDVMISSDVWASEKLTDIEFTVKVYKEIVI